MSAADLPQELPATPSEASPGVAPSVARASARQEPEGIKLIIEQILVAFILAFIFRAFVLEAFVIPTGSMAPTLLGAHMDFSCPDCGWDFTVNYPTDPITNAVPSSARVVVQGPRGARQVVDRTYSVRCPNCTYRFPRVDPGDPANDATAPTVHYGDRILVLKHLYLFQEPQRWDVFVFKNPSRVSLQYEGLPAWSTEPYQQNYIKRLIGLPGETVMLLDGDVYTTRVDKRPSELVPSDFRIERKTDVAQSALWRIVYDDDHRPQGRPRTYATATGLPLTDPGFTVPWTPADGAGWTQLASADGGGFAFENSDGAGTLRFDPNLNPRAFAFTDYLAYDVTGFDQRYRGEGPLADTFERDFDDTYISRWGFRLNTVSDIRLALFYQRLDGDGPLRLSLSKHGEVFEAELTDGRVRVTRTGPAGEVRLDRSAGLPGDFTSPRRVEFINADYRVRLVVDGQTVFQTTDAEYAPDMDALMAHEASDALEPRPQVSIVAERQSATIRHVSLWRDVYYTARDQYGRFNPHGSPEDFPDNVIRLGEREYFPLGDNPFLSGDARGWENRVTLPYEALDIADGRVPERFMLGKAFFVYWPASFSPGAPIPALVPNFGGMRFIR